MIDLDKFGCEHPKLIVNRKAINYIAYGFPFFVFGKRQQKSLACDKTFINWDYFNELLFSVYNPNTGDINQYEASRCFVQCPDGSHEDIFTLVRCGKCLSCAYSKVIRYSNRLMLEGEFSHYPPLFVTLTYRDAPIEPLKRDCQLFLKRLRAILHKEYTDVKVRYFIVAEKGAKKGRVHYHMLLYGMPFNMLDNNEAMQCYRIIALAWSFDRRKFKTFKTDMYNPPSASRFTIQHKNSIGLVEVKPTDGRKALFNYVGKYMFKQDLFYLCSKGLGLSHLDFDDLRKSFVHNPVDSIPLRGRSQLFNLQYDSTLLNKIAPSYGRIFDAQFTRKFQFAGSVLRKLASYGPSFYLSEYRSKLNDYYDFFKRQGLLLQVNFDYKIGHVKLKDAICYNPDGEMPYTKLHDDTILNCFIFLDDVLSSCYKKVEQIVNFKYDIPLLFKCRNILFDSFSKQSLSSKKLKSVKSFASIKNSRIFAL